MQPVEFRLYYDNDGSVLFYTCEKPEGQYIVIDNEEYAACKMNIKVIDGKIFKNHGIVFAQLVHAIDGIACAKQDVSIIVTDDYQDVTTWDIQLHTVSGA